MYEVDGREIHLRIGCFYDEVTSLVTEKFVPQGNCIHNDNLVLNVFKLSFPSFFLDPLLSSFYMSPSSPCFSRCCITVFVGAGCGLVGEDITSTLDSFFLLLLLTALSWYSHCTSSGG